MAKKPWEIERMCEDQWGGLNRVMVNAKVYPDLELAAIAAQEYVDAYYGEGEYTVDKDGKREFWRLVPCDPDLYDFKTMWWEADKAGPGVRDCWVFKV